MDSDDVSFSSDSKNWDLTNEDQDEVALDVHYCATSFYDMMFDRFDWSGIDGEGSEMRSEVHFGGKFYINASWNGKKARFGNGDCDRYGPLTTLDIVGHEFMHGITDNTSDLVYRNESGALNEALSDIFGKALEYYYDRQNFTWNLGERIRRSDDANIFRSMSDPHLRNDPKFYHGHHWVTSSGDNGGVHSNSGVLNYWFYILVEGGEVMSEDGSVNFISPIGMEKTLDLCFILQSQYLTTNSDYIDAMTYSLSVSEDLFGINTSEYQSVADAWRNVGIDKDLGDVDLIIEAIDEDIVICPEDADKVGYSVINVGAKNVLPGAMMNILFKAAKAESPLLEDIILIDTLHVGDTLNYYFDEEISYSPDITGEYALILTYESETNLYNNTYKGRIYFAEFQGFDVFLKSARLDKVSPCNTGEGYRLTYNIEITGCQEIPVGDQLVFDLITEDTTIQLFRENYFVKEPGSSNWSSIVTYDLNDFIIGAYTVEFRHELDENKNNNSISGRLEHMSVITDGYSERFDDLAASRTYEISGNTFYNHDSVIAFDENNMLAFWGERNHDFFRNCPNIEDFFNQYSFKKRLTYCVNTEDMVEPVFAFNLIQFFNEASIANLTDLDFSSIVKISTEDSGHNDWLIFGQPETYFEKYNYELPKEYIGELKIDILTLSRNETNQDYNFFSEKDMVLFDDFNLYDLDNYASNLSLLKYATYPNPVNNLLYFSGGGEDQYDVLVFNQLGQRVLSKSQLYGLSWINMTELPDGIYFVQFIVNGKMQTTKKVLKLSF